MSRTAIAICAAAVVVWTAIGAYLLWPDEDGGGAPGARASRAAPATAGGAKAESRPAERAAGVAYTAGRDSATVELELKGPARAGVLFDVDTGEILWKRAAGRPLPIASLTKMMTALIVSELHGPGERVLISRRAAETNGSKVGLLPAGKRVPLEPLFEALIMASANDAAVALAEHNAGSVSKFVDRMNLEARAMGLRCSHFTTPSGLKNRGNHSCAFDLAQLARADLADRRIARVARTREVSEPFPIDSGRLELNNNHYFLSRGIAGVPGAEVTGLKTGYTIAAGRCYVTTARLGSRHLGVVLLDSPDPFKQVPQLLRAGFEATGELPEPAQSSKSPK
jgi:D-alanyl-D-alanine carboxypeptidase